MSTIRTLVQKYKHRLPTIALVVGFVVDLITFRTLDLFYAQIILATHLTIVACSIIVLALPWRGGGNSVARTVHTWLPILQQYSTGNLLSAFLVLYSASGSFAQSWIFFALLAVAIVANETIRLQKYRLPFQTSLFFLNLLLFVALSLPITLGAISTVTFLLSLVMGAVVFQVFRWVLALASPETSAKHRTSMSRGAQFVLVALTVLYFLNVIPPIPLSLKVADFYHSVVRVGEGYEVTDEPRSWAETFFSITPKPLRVPEGGDTYFFSAVFAPAEVGTSIVHQWEYFDPERGVWVPKTKTRFPIVGGRSEGYRGFSFTEDPVPGVWRVSVETARGQVVGRAQVRVVRVENPVPVTTFQQ